MNEPGVSHKSVYIAFEGGGAKGIVHIGAMKAIEALEGLKVRGVAGTSAGAIVAALCAAQFSAEDILSTQEARSILTFIDPAFKSATDLLGKGYWWRIRLFRLLTGIRYKMKWFLALLFLVPTIVAAFWFCGSPGVLGVVMFCVAATAVTGRLVYGGIASVKHVRKAIDVALCKKLVKDKVVFADFGGRSGRPCLKIVATNISKGRLELFSPELTPDVEVADAVAASICIPLIFAPWGDEDLFFDGGLVCNLPAWPFDEERSLDNTSITVACEIRTSVSDTPLSAAALRRGWLKPTVITTIFGAGELNTRQSGEFVRIQRSTSINTLDFDISYETAKRTVEDAHESAALTLRWELFDKPNLMTATSKKVRDLVLAFLNEQPLQPGSPVGRVRVAFAIREPGTRLSARLRYGAGYEAHDPDNDLRLPLAGSYVGQALESSERLFAAVDWSTFESGFEPEQERTPQLEQLWRRTWKGMRWLLCIPYTTANGGETVVLTIDGDDIPAEDDELGSRMDLLASLIDPIVEPVVATFSEKNFWRAEDANHS